MCTAITYKNRYFGRNLDFEHSFGECITITPRNYPFKFRKEGELSKHYAMIGMAKVSDDYPLYFDATNEKGLSMAGLLFSGNAKYKPCTGGADNIAPFELIPWLLSQCADIGGAKRLLSGINIADINYSDELPNTPLHWIISDKNNSITVEAVGEGIKVYDNPVGVLTNNPTFDIQMFNLNNYRNLSAYEPENTFSDKLELTAYSRGMGGVGLPGDLSSMSRFVRAAFVKLNSVSEDSENENVRQFFHILGAVEQQRGCTRLKDGNLEITLYSSCCNMDSGIYYYKTYDNSSIHGVGINKEELDGDSLVCYPLITEQSINMQN